MIKKIITILFLFIASSTWASDLYDPNSNTLTIPMAKVGDGYYSNVKVKVGKILGVGKKESVVLAYDTYDSSKNILSIPEVVVGNSTYYNVSISIESVISVDRACSTIFACQKKFPLKFIYEQYLSNSHSYTISSSGIFAGIFMSGSGTKEESIIANEFFENYLSLVVAEKKITEVNAGGVSSNGTYEIKRYYNSDKKLIGYTQRDLNSALINSYGVVQAPLLSLPISAMIDDGGDFWTMKTYSDASKATLLFTESVKWALKPGVGAYIAVMELTRKTTVSSAPGEILVSDQYGIDFNNNMMLIKSQLLIKNGSATSGPITETFTTLHPQVQMNTSLGAVVFELNPSAAPQSVDNFLKYVNSGFYSGTIFHRVIPNFIVQAGGYKSGLIQMMPIYTAVALESNNGLSNLTGTLAMARASDPNSATSQFYINIVDNTNLNYLNSTNPGYAVFGRVISGLEIIKSIGLMPTGTFGQMYDVPLTDVKINSMVRIK